MIIENNLSPDKNTDAAEKGLLVFADGMMFEEIIPLK